MTGNGKRLRELHIPGEPIVLPNAWDVWSARAVEQAGFAAVATSSAAVAASLGFADGERGPVDEMFAAVARIANGVRVPVTADVERGYGLTPEELVERLAAAGAAGCNLEDSDPRTRHLIDPADQATFLRQVRHAAERAGYDLVINARVDSFIVGGDDPVNLLRDATHRARHYLEAGADCVYPIMLADPQAIETFVRDVDGPVNTVSHPAAPDVPTLASLGVARVSFGPGLQNQAGVFLSNRLAEIGVPR